MHQSPFIILPFPTLSYPSGPWYIDQSAYTLRLDIAESTRFDVLSLPRNPPFFPLLSLQPVSEEVNDINHHILLFLSSLRTLFFLTISCKRGLGRVRERAGTMETGMGKWKKSGWDGERRKEEDRV